ncbi:MAG TPA: hypothetical protein VNH64_10475, partial [Parvularculaceae bacterium]|nr:hypothetical protein [Parvularculaceae bacterium]
WCARLFRTRSLAAKAAESGSFRLTRGRETMRIEKSSLMVRAGDRVAFIDREQVRVIEILACAARRGPAAEARQLYIECGDLPSVRPLLCTLQRE